MTTDMVNHPPHYNNHPSGVECIQVTEHMNFLLGSAVKYIWRCDDKGKPIQDLEKAVWYLEREIARRQRIETEAVEQPFPALAEWAQLHPDEKEAARQPVDTSTLEVLPEPHNQPWPARLGIDLAVSDAVPEDQVLIVNKRIHDVLRDAMDPHNWPVVHWGKPGPEDEEPFLGEVPAVRLGDFMPDVSFGFDCPARGPHTHTHLEENLGEPIETESCFD